MKRVHVVVVALTSTKLMFYLLFGFAGKEKGRLDNFPSGERAPLLTSVVPKAFEMKTSAGSLNRGLNFRACPMVSTRCPDRNIETALSEPN
jgi:hypothetical protein